MRSPWQEQQQALTGAGVLAETNYSLTAEKQKGWFPEFQKKIEPNGVIFRGVFSNIDDLRHWRVARPDTRTISISGQNNKKLAIPFINAWFTCLGIILSLQPCKVNFKNTLEPLLFPFQRMLRLIYVANPGSQGLRKLLTDTKDLYSLLQTLLTRLQIIKRAGRKQLAAKAVQRTHLSFLHMATGSIAPKSTNPSRFYSSVLVENASNFHFCSFDIYPRLPDSVSSFQSHNANHTLQMEKSIVLLHRRHRQGRQAPKAAGSLERKWPVARLLILPFW